MNCEDKAEVVKPKCTLTIPAPKPPVPDLPTSAPNIINNGLKAKIPSTQHQKRVVSPQPIPASSSWLHLAHYRHPFLCPAKAGVPYPG